MEMHIQHASTKRQFCNLPGAPYRSEDMSHDPIGTTYMDLNIPMVWADPRSLATTSGVAKLLSFPRGTEMFQFPRLASRTYVFSTGSPGFARRGCPIRRSTGSLLPANRGLSQVATSFIASWCQGIHRIPLIAWPKIVINLAPCGARVMG